MYNNKRSVMGKWKRTLIAAALTASVILALPVWNVERAHATEADEPKKLNLEEKCTLTISRTVEDAKRQGDVVVDLYRVADAVPSEGYDAYTLTLLEAYKGLEKDLRTAMSEGMKDGKPNNPNVNGVNASYRKLAQAAAEIALEPQTVEEEKDGETISVQKPTGVLEKQIDLSEGKKEDKAEGLEPGMYLVIAHGKDLTVDRYVARMAVNDYTKEDAPEYVPGIDSQTDQIVTKAYSDGYAYTYLPELISLPARVDENGNIISGSFNTADTAHRWETTLTATLKSEQSRELAALRITKTFAHEDSTPLSGDELIKEDGFAFRYEVYLDEEFLFSDVETIYYKAGEPNRCDTEKKIPVDATVRVTEIYSGAAFSPETLEGKTAVRNPESGMFEVTFNNTYTGNNTGGNVINNRFTYNSSDGWNPVQDPLKDLDNSLVSSEQTEP